jgi:hypothetical protein
VICYNSFLKFLNAKIVKIINSNKLWPKNKNPLTAKGAEILHKDRKDLNINVLSLRPLRNPLRALRLKRLQRSGL